MNNQPPYIRVSRKRCADPHDAMIVHIKKHRRADAAVVFKLFKTKDGSAPDEELRGIRVVDYSQGDAAVPNPAELGQSNSASAAAVAGPSEPAIPPIHQELDFVGDEAIGEIGDHRQEQKEEKKPEERIMLNGQVMIPVNANPDDVVFDYYRLDAANDHSVEFFSNEFSETDGMPEEDFDVRFANNHEAELVASNFIEDEDSDHRADDDDDSNDEDNWRNEYPDEDSYDDDSDDAQDSYGESTSSQQWQRNAERFPCESMQRRFQNFGINDRYESYFEGEDTSGDEEEEEEE